MPQTIKERRRRLKLRQAAAYEKHGPDIMFADNSSKIVGVMPFPRDMSAIATYRRYS